ncbi:MAG: triose-phosphate isomerase [Pseudomonadota bacterium]
MLVIGNWKMNGSTSMGKSLVQGLVDGLPATDPTTDGVTVVVCPPAPYIGAVAGWIGDGQIAVGGQTCHGQESGAHTGDVAPEMLADCGATYVIVGHSERRHDHGETDRQVQDQAKAAIRAGLTPIICVGETKQQREAGEADAVVTQQLQASVPDGVTASQIIIAYEPVWAIGTGLTASTDDIAAMHQVIAQVMATLTADGSVPSLLYGGSVKPGNAAEIFAVEHVNGGLIGGASLKAEDFLGIIRAAM